MTSKVIYEIITILCCSICAASIQGQGKFLFGKDTGWNLARKTCQDNQTRLPNVKISESGLQLADIIHWSPNECFWIGATYERVTNYSYGTFPTFCCGTITKENGNFVRACDNCETREQFICESGLNTVSNYMPHFGPLPWINASKECTGRGLLLPSENNTMFLGRVYLSVWWINEARILNLSPIAAKNGDIPLCFCDASSPNFQCSTNVKTYCMPYTRTNITSGILQQSMPSTDTYSTKPIVNVVTMNSELNVNATSSIQPGSKLALFSTNTYATVTSITYLDSTSSAVFFFLIIIFFLKPGGESLSENSNLTPKIDTRFQSVTPSTIINTGPTGNGTLVGSLIGSAVAVIFILAIGIAVIVRRIRTKRRATDDIQYESHVNVRSNKEVESQMNGLYGVVFDDTLDMDLTSTVLPRIQTVSQEPELHIHNVNQISITNKDDDKRENSKVQKRQRKKYRADVIEECSVNNNEYDNIEFENVSEPSGDMYDNATRHRLEPDNEQDANVYNRTGFSFTMFDKNDCNVYEKDNSHDNITQEDNDFIDGTYDYVEC